MGLDIPSLDDRTYEELREAAVKRIPVHAPEWTDHNAHDPGITILELLAWLVERDGYRLDRITDEHRRRYLSLVGVTPRPPAPASVELAVPPGEAVASAPTDHRVPAGTSIDATPPDGEPVGFETTTDVTLTSATLAAVVSVAGDGRTDLTAANDREGRSFRPFGADARTENTFNLGFDADPFAGTDRLELTVEFDDAGLPDVDGHPADPVRFVPSIEVVWERLMEPERWWADDAWEPLETVHDGTTDFHDGGRIVLSTGDTSEAGTADENETVGEEVDGETGHEGTDGETGHEETDGETAVADASGDDATPLAAGVLGRTEPLGWIRAVARARPERPASAEGRPDGGAREGRDHDRTFSYECPPRFDAVRTNVVPATQREEVADVALDRVDDGEDRPTQPPTETTGGRAQRFAFPRSPVESATIHVGGDRWETVTDFAASGATDQHVLLDHEAGEVLFGDGRHGMIPDPDLSVRAETAVYGGGERGNLPRGTRWRVDLGEEGIEAIPITRASGGAPAETIPEAFERARTRQETSHRAVTRADYRAIGRRTHGVRVGRIEPIVGERTAEPVATNTVTVVAVPYGPPGRYPEPTPGFLDAVEYQLCTHSLLTDRVRVVAPTYVGVRVGATIRVAADVTEAEARRAVTDRLTAYIDPLTGFDGDGWPFDRPVHRSDLFETIDRLPPVEDVVDVTVTTGDEGDLAADPTTVPYLSSVTVEFREERRTCGRGV